MCFEAKEYTLQTSNKKRLWDTCWVIHSSASDSSIPQLYILFSWLKKWLARFSSVDTLRSKEDFMRLIHAHSGTSSMATRPNWLGHNMYFQGPRTVLRLLEGQPLKNEALCCRLICAWILTRLFQKKTEKRFSSLWCLKHVFRCFSQKLLKRLIGCKQWRQPVGWKPFSTTGFVAEVVD